MAGLQLLHRDVRRGCSCAGSTMSASTSVTNVEGRGCCPSRYAQTELRPCSVDRRLAGHLPPSCWCLVVPPAVAGPTPLHRQGSFCRPTVPLPGGGRPSQLRPFMAAYVGLPSCWPCLPCPPLGCVPRVAAPLGRYASTAVERQLLACRWPCRVWWTNQPPHPGSRCKEWQPLVSAA